MTNIARTSDPQTSHIAAEKMDSSGRRLTIKARVLAELVAAGKCYVDGHRAGLTHGAIASISGISEAQAHKRCSDLKNDGLIEQRGVRKWMGNDQGVWHLIDRQGELWE